MAKRRLRRSRAIIGALVVLVLAGVAATIFVLDYHQARSNAKDDKITDAKDKAAVGYDVQGTVTAVTKTALTVRLSNAKVRRISIATNTRIQNATPGSVADVQKGLRSLVRFKTGAPPALQEILVLPAKSRIGQLIIGTGFGLVWRRTTTGQTGAKVSMVDASVETAHDAPLTDVVVGAKVIVHAQNTVVKPVRAIASEVVVLPAATALVS